MNPNVNIYKLIINMACSCRVFVIGAVSLFAGIGYAEPPIQTGFVFSYGITNENFAPGGGAFNPDHTGQLFQFGFQGVKAGKLLEKDGGGAGLSVYYSSANIMFDDALVIRNDTLLAGQKLNANHWGVSISAYAGTLVGAFRPAVSIGYEWFTFSNQNTGGVADFRHIPAYTRSGLTLELGMIAFKTIGQHFVVQLHPYVRASTVDFREYNPSLDAGSVQYGAMLSFVVQN